jgi:predicted transcriptional regulator
MRTEILNFLLQKGSSFPAEISEALGYRYHRVISDIQVLIRDGAIIDSFAGRKRQLKISPAFHDFLNAIPLCHKM